MVSGPRPVAVSSVEAGQVFVLDDDNWHGVRFSGNGLVFIYGIGGSTKCLGLGVRCERFRAEINLTVVSCVLQVVIIRRRDKKILFFFLHFFLFLNFLVFGFSDFFLQFIPFQNNSTFLLT